MTNEIFPVIFHLIEKISLRAMKFSQIDQHALQSIAEKSLDPNR